MTASCLVRIDANDIFLFAIHTGELYQRHLQLARDEAPINAAGVTDNWLDHVSGPVMTLYSRQVERAWATLETRLRAARDLKTYYELHVSEMLVADKA